MEKRAHYSAIGACHVHYLPEFHETRSAYWVWMWKTSVPACTVDQWVPLGRRQ